MEEIKCEQVGQLIGSGFTEMSGRVYSTTGLTPSIRTFWGQYGSENSRTNYL